ncbi:MAG: hypothetical protein ACYC7F_00975 [Gemmatimonadaceae bacterium]
MTGGTLDHESLDRLISEACEAAPLPFLRQFLREQRGRGRRIGIGATAKQARENLRDAIAAKLIGTEDVRAWILRVEGWGHQHLYLYRCHKPSHLLPQLLNRQNLERHLKKTGVEIGSEGDPAADGHQLTRLYVDDELVRLSWVAFDQRLLRRLDLDQVHETDDCDYELHAYERRPTRSLAHLVLRKTDGLVLVLVDLPLGESHTRLKERVLAVSSRVLAPIQSDRLALSNAITNLDSRAIAAKGPKASRDLSMSVSPTHAGYRTDGARVDFRSTAEGHGYEDVDAVRTVRRALAVDKFSGDGGRFRLRFDSQAGTSHDMVMSIDARDDRVYLFSSMLETEVFALADVLLELS